MKAVIESRGRNTRYGARYEAREDLKGNRGGWGDHQHPEYPDPDWDRNTRRPLNPEWDARDNWDVDQHKQAASGTAEEEWRHYNRSMDGWNNEDRRRWPQEWRDRSRPRSAASPHVENLSGQLFDITGSYNPGFIMAGTAIAISGVILFAIPPIQRWQANKKQSKQINIAL